jgi:putative transposase
MLAHRENADLAKQLIETTIEKQNVPREQLILHSDRGPSMTSHSVAQLLGSLGVTKSHSRPHVSNDNPFSESQFKTMKYRPEFPKRFGCYEDALGFCRDFFGWYNDEHYHSGIGLLTPSSLHYGQSEEIIELRKQTLHGAWEKNPERFVNGTPTPGQLPRAVWINAPKRDKEQKNEAPEANCPGAPEETSLTHPRSGYPLDGCVPAEPPSVSPDDVNVAATNTLNTRAMPKKIPGFQGLAPDHAGSMT